jgi:hypothetical protein
VIQQGLTAGEADPTWEPWLNFLRAGYLLIRSIPQRMPPSAAQRRLMRSGDLLAFLFLRVT